MTKIYKINGKEIHGFQGRWDGTVEGKINELLEALSDKEEIHWKDCHCDTCIPLEEPKQEECKHNKIKHINNLNGDIIYSCCDSCSKPWSFDSKQSISLKEEVRKLVKECVYVGELSSEKISDQILKLIQSHLVKEIENSDYFQICQGCSCDSKEDIIKIINNITK